MPSLVTVLCWLVLASPGAPAAAYSEPTSLRPGPDLDLAALAGLVGAHAPEIEAAGLEVDLAAAALRQSRILANPSLELGWSTIPVGRLNPPELTRPLANVPNYSVGLEYTVPAGKRRPQIRRAQALQAAAKARLEAHTRALSLQLAAEIGQLAVITLRRDGVFHLVEDAARAISVAETRLASGFGTPLDLDRLRIDLGRTEQLLRSADSDHSATLAACSGLIAMRCEGFASSGDARAFLARWIDSAALPSGGISDRPDLRALAALEQAAAAEHRLARAQAIPSPTLHLGYLHDRFLTSGNQMNSLNLGVAIPLPIFDRGQAAQDAARARQRRFASERHRRTAAGEARARELMRRVDAQSARQQALSGDLLPRAAGVLAELERAADTRLVPLGDVLHARRTMSELLVEEADSYADAFTAAIELLAELPPTDVAEGR